MIRRARHLTVFVLAAASGMLVLLELRFFFLQMLRPSEVEKVAAYQTVETSQPGVRGRLFDARGGLIAGTGRGARVRVWAKGLRDDHKNAVVDLLQREVGADPDLLRLKLDAEDYPIVVEEVSDAAVLERLELAARRWEYRSIRFEPRYHRSYPYRQLFAPWVGFVDAGGGGVVGLEALFDEEMAPSTEGRRRHRRDGRGQAMLDAGGEWRPAQDGADVRLSLDPLIQQSAERALEECVEEFSPRWAQAIVVRPGTGEVLAVAQRPAPRNGRPASEEAMEQQYLMAVQEQYTPGSTIKPFVLALCMREGKVRTDEIIDCENGLHYFGRRRLTDHDGGYGELTVPELLVHSSNIGMAKLLCRLVEGYPPKGSPCFVPIRRFFEDFGFGKPVFGLPREQDGPLRPLSEFSKVYTLVSWAFGHEMSVTAMQMAQAASSLIGPGELRPLVLRRAEAHAPTPSADPTVPAPIVASLRRMMEAVVAEGATAKLRPAGYSMGGKTGTAQKERDRSKDTMSFFCFAPVEDPQVAVLAVVDEPSKGRFASEVAAPVASQILGDALKSLMVVPDRPEELIELEESSAGGSTRGGGRR